MSLHGAFRVSVMVVVQEQLFSTSCKCGGLVIQRHNEIRDSLGDLCAHSFPSVVRKPIVCEAG